jgi:putative DNA primase/helicase
VTDDKELKKIQEQVEKRRAQIAKSLECKAEDNGLDSRFINDCLNASEFGDGCLFAVANKGSFLFDTLAGEWYRWAQHFWDRDIDGYAFAACEGVCQKLLDETDNLAGQAKEAGNKGNESQVKKYQKQQIRIYKRIERLRTVRGRHNCLQMAKKNDAWDLSVRSEIFDTDPWLLGCKNGVIDLRTGELTDGRPEQFISNTSPTEYKGVKEPAPEWEKFLYEVFKKNDALLRYINRLFGYGLTGSVKETILPVFWGQGRNGKGTLLETIKFVLGDLASPIAAELLLDQGRARSSAGASPDIMALKGLRIAWASESDEGRKFSPSKVKWLTGGDTLVGRNPYDRNPTHFSPTHKLFLITNNKPHAPPDDFAFWERVHLIPFELSFVNREPQAENELPADKDLMDKLKKEACGILAWLVRGCIQWQEHGLEPPPIVLEATAEYRRDEDTLGDFVDECCFLDPEKFINASELYTAFREWWTDNISKTKIMSQRKFGKIMQLKFKREKVGTYRYYGLGLDERGLGLLERAEGHSN